MLPFSDRETSTFFHYLRKIRSNIFPCGPQDRLLNLLIHPNYGIRHFLTFLPSFSLALLTLSSLKISFNGLEILIPTLFLRVDDKITFPVILLQTWAAIHDIFSVSFDSRSSNHFSYRVNWVLLAFPVLNLSLTTFPTHEIFRTIIIRLETDKICT